MFLFPTVMDIDIKWEHFTPIHLIWSLCAFPLGLSSERDGLSDHKKQHVDNFPDICKKCNLSDALMMSAGCCVQRGIGLKCLWRSQGKPFQMERGAVKGTPLQQKELDMDRWVRALAQLEPIIGVILIQFNQSEWRVRKGRWRGGRVQMLVKYLALTEELSPSTLNNHPLSTRIVPFPDYWNCYQYHLIPCSLFSTCRNPEIPITLHCSNITQSMRKDFIIPNS